MWVTHQTAEFQREPWLATHGEDFAADNQRPVRRIERMALLIRQLYETGGDVFAVEHAAAGADPDVAESWARHHRERGENLFRIVEPLRAHLAPGLEPARALEIVQAFVNYGVYEELVVISGWTADEYETWLGRTLCDQLLAPPTYLIS